MESIESMESSRPEFWSGSPFPSPEDLPNLGIEPMSPALQVDSLPAEPQGKPQSSEELGKVCIKCTYIALYYAVTYDSFVAQSYKGDKIWSPKT